MFSKVLIANRGAIAVRIARTLRRMGIRSVAVYTKADQDSLHVDQADEAVLIGEGPAKDSYLNADAILRAARETGAEAIHPGYGFLSENAGFARRCRESGIVFIGPEPEQMERFGLKHEARAIAERAGVPLLPGTELIGRIEDAVLAADRIGYPVMLKSTAGGGGIGMRACGGEAELRAAFDAVGRLAEASFGDGGVFLEKYVAKARHVEVQIFGNRFGEVVALGERDCSIQRRNQKVIEETPAPNLPSAVRAELHAAAVRLAAEAGYRSAGTVEFLYDPQTHGFYFLEVNTRLQVEHGVTEEVFGIDLVEWMVREAADEWKELGERVPEPKGHSIQARIYAEDCLQGFRPSAGQLDRAVLPDGVRVESWVRDGMTVTTLYDPMLAKVIARADTREEAIGKLVRALEETRFYGITTNLQYVRSLLQEEDCASGLVHTRMLDGFQPAERAIEVLDGGLQTTVQDWPGRAGYWNVGVPPCGPMDPLSHRIGNRLLGNAEDAPGLELTLRGGAYRFRGDMRFCLTGADMKAELDGEPVAPYRPTLAKRGQTLRLAEAEAGMRAYLLVQGGFDVPRVLGSASTFTLGGFGGHGGRALRAGDVIGVRGGESALPGAAPDRESASAWATEAGRTSAAGTARTPIASAAAEANPATAATAAAVSAPDAAAVPEPDMELDPAYRPAISRSWTIGAIPGPHCTEEFLRPEYLQSLTETEWEVHFNSSRTGVRLIGPAPSWAREDGGDAGLHPSNIHDNAYAVGALDLTGDMPILLGPDGPSLGGFVCPVTVPSAELWKLGQLHPGDRILFRLVTLEEADLLRAAQERMLEAIGADAGGGASVPAGAAFGGSKRLPAVSVAPVRRGPAASDVTESPAAQREWQTDYPVLAREREGRRFPITVRISGDRNLLVEYGPMELDLRLRFQVHALMEAVRSAADFPVRDLTPGIRSLQIQLDPECISLREACERVMELDRALPPLESLKVPSRIVRLPLSWDDPSTRLAIERYQQNVRPDAPWCPSNLEFIRRINGLESIDEVQRIVFDANYLVLGLGDVYLGAPVATPVDPRHRLVTTKYNPARTWTPENAVGIGGAYLCVYGMEGPGGYQFVGRTVQMWNRLRSTGSFPEGKPWLLRFFDQIRFYPVAADELLRLREDFLRGRFEVEVEETTFDLGEYLRFLDSIEASAREFRSRQQAAFQAEREDWKRRGLAEYASEQDGGKPLNEEELPAGVAAVRSPLPGSVWKVNVEPGGLVGKGDKIAVVESMKMEFEIEAPEAGRVSSVHVAPGDGVQAGQLMIGIAPAK
ncbi:biotin carboxylase N-terminal domain-containing protein [Cohnella algarum]|uniref:ATP-binding protein n=1 Tax=Cohnella algarum TaxID=2044859 RepID=UPI001967E3AA|nr:biotin carboxylase N-terminal domain-containing protein [Cohnella algarum]MBN2982465.1 carboxyltransferase domain-containing protein [Cohnella algarum]